MQTRRAISGEFIPRWVHDEGRLCSRGISRPTKGVCVCMRVSGGEIQAVGRHARQCFPSSVYRKIARGGSGQDGMWSVYCLSRCSCRSIRGKITAVYSVHSADDQGSEMIILRPGRWPLGSRYFTPSIDFLFGDVSLSHRFQPPHVMQ